LSPSDREEAKRCTALVRRALLEEWDPIGVKDSPHAQDEYDAYVSEVVALVTRHATSEEIFGYLWWLETEHMGLDGDWSATQKVARALCDLCDQPESGEL
jgi:hypothetical protein